MSNNKDLTPKLVCKKSILVGKNGGKELLRNQETLIFGDYWLRQPGVIVTSQLYKGKSVNVK